jgi:hypothetical protein
MVFQKRSFASIRFGMLALVVVTALIAPMRAPTVVRRPALLAPLAMSAVGVVLMRKRGSDLVDEVRDRGEQLVVRRAGVEERIALATTMNASASMMTRPPRVTLRVGPRHFGREVSSVPLAPFALNPFARNAVAGDQIERAYRARMRPVHATDAGVARPSPARYARARVKADDAGRRHRHGGARDAATASLLRVLRPRPAAGFGRSAYLFLRVHVLRRLRRGHPRGPLSQLRRRARGPSAPCRGAPRQVPAVGRARGACGRLRAVVMVGGGTRRR